MPYVIRNCPACYLYGNKYGCEDNHDKQGRDTYCELIDDCVMKQIITICKWYKMSKEDMKRSKESADIIRGSKYGGDALAIQILQLLQIRGLNDR